MPHEEHKEFNSPEDDPKIWRYMDFTQFLSILERKSLFFNRSDRFEDPFEGSIPKANLENEQTAEWLVDAVETWQMEGDADPSEVPLRDAMKAMGTDISKMYNSFRYFTFINCWHMNENESGAMWDLYLKTNEGIAIQSHFENFTSALENSEEAVHVGEVEYINFEEETVPEMTTFIPYLRKRESFHHESELRAIVRSTPEINQLEEDDERQEIDLLMDSEDYILSVDEDGKNGYIPINPNALSQMPKLKGKFIKIDLNELIDKIYLAPTSPEWFEDLVQKVLDTYDVDVPITRSNLDTDPVY